MKINVMLVFDIIITALGIIVITTGFTSIKKGIVTAFFLPEEDLRKVKDKNALCQYLFPIVESFGGICLMFGIESLINDTFYPLPKLVYLASVFLFITAWLWFSMMLKKARDKFVSPF